MKSVIFVVLALLAVAYAKTALLSEDQYQFLFTRFVQQYSKQYEVEHFFSRYSTFKDNLNAIIAHNAQVPAPSYTLAINAFGDMTSEEFKSTMLTYKSAKPAADRLKNVEKVDANVAIPTSVDWRNHNAVTGVKNQGQCGGCWSFSTTGSVEGAWAIAKGQLISLSEQQLIDCAGSYGNNGCNGGMMDYAFEYIIANGGICTEASYPYTAADGNCTSCQKVVTISSYKNVAPNSESALMAAVAKGPVSIAIEADQMAFQFYSGGVFSAACGTALDHGVLVVGYGTGYAGSSASYWIVKNSWGSSWGASGYIYIERGSNLCGLLSEPSYPIV